MLRLGWILALGLAACSTSDAKSAPPKQAGADPLGALVKLTDHVEKLAEADKADKDDQRARLEKRIANVEALVDAGQLDRAEIEASSVRWLPDPTRSRISESEHKLIEQYDERRETLMRVIQRLRAHAP